MLAAWRRWRAWRRLNRECHRRWMRGSVLLPTVNADPNVLPPSAAIAVPPPNCPRCGCPMFKIATPFRRSDDSWRWGHDCQP